MFECHSPSTRVAYNPGKRGRTGRVWQLRGSAAGGREPRHAQGAAQAFRAPDDMSLTFFVHHAPGQRNVEKKRRNRKNKKARGEKHGMPGRAQILLKST